MFSLIWQDVIIALKCRILDTLAPHFTAEDYRIQGRGPPANYAYGCHVALVTREALGYVSYQEGHPGHWCPGSESLGLCSRIAFQAILSLDLSTQTVSFISYL